MKDNFRNFRYKILCFKENYDRFSNYLNKIHKTFPFTQIFDDLLDILWE